MALALALRRNAAFLMPGRARSRLMAVRTMAFREEKNKPAHMDAKPADQTSVVAQHSEPQDLAARQEQPMTLETLPFRRMADAMTTMQREMDAMMNSFGVMGTPLSRAPLSLLDELASDMFPAPTLARPGRFNRIVPIEVQEDDKQYTLHAEVPGFRKEDIKVTLDPASNTVTITGNVERAEGGGKQGDKTAAPTMRSHMTFTRTLALPPDVDTEQELTARTQDGVLTLTLPKMPAKPAPEVKHIPVH